MMDIVIDVDGSVGDTADLYQALCSTRLPPDVQLSALAKDNGGLGLVDTIIAAVGTLAGVGSLIVAIAGWKATSRSSVSFVVGRGRRVTIDHADRETIDMVWQLVQQSSDAKNQPRDNEGM